MEQIIPTTEIDIKSTFGCFIVKSVTINLSFHHPETGEYVGVHFKVTRTKGNPPDCTYKYEIDMLDGGDLEKYSDYLLNLIKEKVENDEIKIPFFGSFNPDKYEEPFEYFF